MECPMLSGPYRGGTGQEEGTQSLVDTTKVNQWCGKKETWNQTSVNRCQIDTKSFGNGEWKEAAGEQAINSIIFSQESLLDNI